jgi:hypothetical protein
VATVTDRAVRRHPLLDDAQWLREMYESGKSIATIGASIGMSSTSVHRAMRRMNVETRSRPKPDPSAQARLRDPAWLGERWLRDHATLGEMSTEIGAAPSTIWLALVAHGLAEREVTEETRQRMSAAAKTRPPVTPESSARRRQAQTARRARELEKRERKERLFNIALLAVLLNESAQQQKRLDQRREDQLAAPKAPAVIFRETLDTYRRDGVAFEESWLRALDDLAYVMGGITPTVRENLEWTRPAFRQSFLGLGKPIRLPHIETEAVDRW